MKTKNGSATFKNAVANAMKRKKYEPQEGGKMETSKPMARMRAIAFDPRTARQIINRHDKLHDDDAVEAAAKAKRERKMAKRVLQTISNQERKE